MDAHADTSKIEAADRALLKERTQLQELENQLEETNLAQSRFKENATALTAVVVGIGTALFSCATSVASYADDILTLSQNTGIATDELQKLEYASNFVDVSLESITGAMSKLTKNVESAGDRTSKLGQTFAQLHVKVKDSSGELRSSNEIFYDVIDALQKIDNQTERDSIAMSIFGKSAQELSGVIEAGSAGLKSYGEEAQKLGLVMSGEELRKAGEFQDAIDKLSASFESLKNNLGLTVIPILTKLFDAIASIPAPVLSTIAVITGIITTLVLLTKTVNSTMTAASGIAKVVSGLTSGTIDPMMVKIAGITALVIGLVAAITALVAAIATLKGKGDQMNQTLTSVGYAVSGGRTGHNATGTKSWKGGPTWVGENGPEIVDVPAGSRIYNNQESNNMSNKTYNITMNCDLSRLKSVNDVVEAISGIGDSVGCGVV